MSWNYRVVEYTDGGGFGLHEVYYSNEGEAISMTERPVGFSGDTKIQLYKSIMMANDDAHKRPVLAESAITPITRERKKMNIYLVSRTDKVGYDEYDSFVVFAESAEEAIGYDASGEVIDWAITPTNYSNWARAQSDIEAILIGQGTGERGYIPISSFNAG